MKFLKNPITVIQWAFGIIGILALWNTLPRITNLIKPGLLLNNQYLIFFAFLGAWIGFMLVIYRKKASLYRRLLGTMIFLSLGLFVFSWLSVNTSLANKNIEVYANLLLALCLIASVIDSQFSELNDQVVSPYNNKKPVQ